jgi:predicted dehydrogenase
MRIGVIGLGSMGKRRVRDLVALGQEVVGFDLRADRNVEAWEMFGIQTAPDFAGLLHLKPDALVISTPPDQHLMYYKLGFTHRLPFFSEANVLTPRAEWFAEQEERTGVRSYPSATMQFYPLLNVLRQQINEIGKEWVNSVHAHYASYLPLWHPWEHYSEYYAGRSWHTGAAREMVPFEMDWVCWIFGPVRAVCCVHDQRIEWTTDIDDTYTVLLEFESGLRGTLLLEMHQVMPFRTGRIACRKQGFLLDMAAHELHRYDLEGATWKHIKPPGTRALSSFYYEHVYTDEITAYVAALEGTAIYPKTWTEDRHLSNILFAAEESWRRKTWVTVAEVESLYDGQSWVHA